MLACEICGRIKSRKHAVICYGFLQLLTHSAQATGVLSSSVSVEYLMHCLLYDELSYCSFACYKHLDDADALHWHFLYTVMCCESGWPTC